MARRLIFIYKADAGLLSALWDSARKLARSPQACDLCTITHGLLAERRAWKKLSESLGVHTVYYHRDEVPPPIQAFLGQKGLELPIVLLEEKSGYEVAAGSRALKECRGDPQCLKGKLEKVLGRRGRD